MDRTAWIAVILCVAGLVLWEVYLAKQIRPKPLAAPGTNAAPVSSTPVIAPSAPAPSASPAPDAGSAPAETTPPFQEAIETLSNSDVELRLTNRGGGIAEAILLHDKAEQNAHVVLNSSDRLPVGAIIDNPAAPLLPEYKIAREGDVIRFERALAERVTIRKKFFFQKSAETKDNFVAELDVDLENGGAAPYANPGYFVALGGATSIHPKDYPSYTRLVWCIDGKAKGIDVGWFGGGGGWLGMGQRAARPFYQENIAGAEWVAVSDQFFTTLMAPLSAKANQVWGRRFDINRAPDQKVLGIEGALGMPGFALQPGQSYSARFEIYAGPKLYHRLAQLPHRSE